MIGAGAHPLDEDATKNEHELYVLVDGFHEIVGYRIESDGSLTQIASAAVPVGAGGLAAYDRPPARGQALRLPRTDHSRSSRSRSAGYPACRISVIPSRTERITWTLRGSSRTCSLKATTTGVPSMTRPPASVLSAAIRPWRERRGSVAS